MVSRVSFFYGHKEAAAGRTNVATCFKGQFDAHPVIQNFRDLACHHEKLIHWCGPSKLNIVRGGDGAGRFG